MWLATRSTGPRAGSRSACRYRSRNISDGERVDEHDRQRTCRTAAGHACATSRASLRHGPPSSPDAGPLPACRPRVILPMIDPVAPAPPRTGGSARRGSHGAVPSWSVVVPAKRLAAGQDPAAAARPPAASAPDHDDLVLALLADTVAAALRLPAVARGGRGRPTTRPAARRSCAALGARTVADEPDAGLNPALEHGAAQPSPARVVAALSSDLPGAAPRGARRRARGGGRPCRARFVADAARAPARRCSPPSGVAAAPAVRPGLGRRATAPAAPSPLPATGPGCVRDVDTAPTCAPRWRSAPVRARRHCWTACCPPVADAPPFTCGAAPMSAVPAESSTRTRPLPTDRFLNRELSWLDFNARVLALAEDHEPAAAGAGEVPGDLRQQPRRVLHGPGRRAEAPAEHGPRRCAAPTA